MNLRLGFVVACGILGCGPDVAPTQVDSETESGTGAAEESEGSTSTESTAESVDESSSSSDVGTEVWCIDVQGVDAMRRNYALDIDGDGRVELWNVSSDGDPLAGAVTTNFLGQAFDGEVLVDIAEFSRDGSFIQFADIDGDTRPDAVMEPSPDAAPHFLRGTASGELDDVAMPITGWEPSPYAPVLDVTGDGAVDVLRFRAPTLEIHVGDGEGNFALAGALDVLTPVVQAEIEVEFDGDLVIVVSPYGFGPLPTEVIVVSVAADGTATERGHAIPGGVHIEVLDMRDRDGDGDPEVLVLHGLDPRLQTVRLSWLDAEGGTLTEDVVLEPDIVRALGDFDLDGTVDLIDEFGVRWGITSEPEPLQGAPVGSRWLEGDFDLDGRADFYSSSGIWNVEPCDGP